MTPEERRERERRGWKKKREVSWAEERKRENCRTYNV